MMDKREKGTKRKNSRESISKEARWISEEVRNTYRAFAGNRESDNTADEKETEIYIRVGETMRYWSERFRKDMENSKDRTMRANNS